MTIYRQYTKCTPRASYIGVLAGQIIIAAAVAALPLIVGAAIVPGLAIVALGALIAYCRWWLYDRLICLGKDVCAVGTLLTAEPPDEKSGFDALDTDFSLNILLAGNALGASLDDVRAGPQGWLVENQFPGDQEYYGMPIQRWVTDAPTQCMHCEFEGGGVYTLLQAASAALALAVAAAVFCSIPLIGWIVCLILGLIAAAVIGIGLAVALNDQADPESELGEFEDAKGDNPDLLVIMGTWVYDTAHEGWNEIHPIKHCQKIGHTPEHQLHHPQPLAGDIKPLVERWCDAIGTAGDPLTVAAQGQPENLWEIHPEIDGCAPEPVDEPDDPPEIVK